MILSDFIGTYVKYENEIIKIDFVGLVNGYVFFAYLDKEKRFRLVNSKKVSIEIEYINRPTLHGKTFFIGPSIINAVWYDDDQTLIKAGFTKILESSLADVKIRNKGKPDQTEMIAGL